MEIATDRLGFDRAARRVFLENGDEIKQESQLLKNAVVYISCGEEFRDPFETTKRQIDQSRTIQWRSEGVRFAAEKNSRNSGRQQQHKWSDDEQPTTTTSGTSSPVAASFRKPKSNRLMQNSRCTRRLVAYENGKEFDPVIVFWEFISNSFRTKMHSDEIEKLEERYLREFFTDCKNR